MDEPPRIPLPLLDLAARTVDELTDELDEGSDEAIAAIRLQ